MLRRELFFAILLFTDVTQQGKKQPSFPPAKAQRRAGMFLAGIYKMDARLKSRFPRFRSLAGFPVFWIPH